ncbi:peptidoglycan binding protein CsiV [Marinobacterium sediminicola]|uniref:Peptidoglycan-binding protein, CsiV n=1 Tax=Marinobacterium sediminicola TaxID=518898 RepID=A0ABY1RX65_9GAMM|nr:peptidoglycan binding protein CsiV [Marinobacterium sediminicola]ULG67860.1 peptidoglycan binding protein CsiV [Marinobacterium sediminicola]SMR71439.1 Peptidoglycan-binding protein, CsiV [Marinobacterium sediminicola]
MAFLLPRSLALAALTSLPATAFAADLFKVEVVVFSHENPNSVEQEYWPQLPPLDLSASLFPQPWDGYPLSSFEELPQNDLVLGGQAAALSRSGNYKLLYHRGWLQPVGGKSSARSIRIKVDFDDLQLDGNIRVYKNRFLHAQPTLELTASPMLNQEQPDVSGSNVGDSGIKTLTPVGEPLDLTQRWRMEQSRRMRSNETHYIDHPRFGVLLRIRPVDS